MRGYMVTSLFVMVALAIHADSAHAQRGRGGMQRGGGGGGMQSGGGGGGMQRGGGGMQGNPGMNRGEGGQSMSRPGGGGEGMSRGGMQAGGMGGGMTPHSYQGGMSEGGASMGPYSRSSASTASGTAANRPGYGAGGVGGPDSGVGVRPGMGAGRPGMGAGGVGGPDSGVGVRPGMGAGAAGVPGNPYAKSAGTYYADNEEMMEERNRALASSHMYPPCTTAAYGAIPGAWQPTNMASPSLYANPGYGSVAGMTGMPAQPAPQNYGSNVVSQPTGVYVNGSPAGTPQEYAQQAGQIASRGNAAPDPNDQWMPLGVFAMVQDPQAQPTDLFQLAVNKSGTIRGNYHNVTNNQTTPLAGAVDPKSQRAAWTIGGDQTPVYEAGIANLTTDQTTMLVHTPDGQQKQFGLVRLPDPQSGAGGAPGDAPSPPSGADNAAAPPAPEN